MDHDIDLGGLDPGVVEGGVRRSEREVAVEEAAIDPAPLVSPAELVVQPSLMDPKVLDDPLGLEKPPIGASGTKVLQDLLVRDSVVRQV
jgi:hypothetical protein